MAEQHAMTLSVVIPVYNEKDTLRDIVALVKHKTMVTQIVLVDDASTDGTREIVKEYEADPVITVCLHEKNSGKGAALRTGFAHATGDMVLVQDADLEYDPDDYESLIGPILENRADVVYGSRFLGGPHRVLYFWHYQVNMFLTLLSNVVNNLNLTDMEVCYKVFRRSVLERVKLTSHRFGFEPEITSKVARLKIRMYEVPIRYYGRTYAEGKKISWKDGVAALWWIIWYGLFRR